MSLILNIATMNIQPVFVFLIIILGIWSLVWKGIALWKSAINKNLAWFIVLLVLNTLGILPLLYIFIFSKTSKKKRKK